MQDSTTDADARVAMTNTAGEFLGALIVIARDGTILSWNYGAEALFGYGSHEVIGQSLQDTIVPPELREEKPRWLEALGDGGSTIFEAERRRRDGMRIWVDVAVKVVRNENGARFLILNERDITPIRYQREAQALAQRTCT